MRSGITRQALRRHRWSLLGPACTQVLAAGVIATMVMTAMSLDRSDLTASERHASTVADIPDTTTVFIGISVYLSILIVGVTMNLAMSRQLRDIALLRTIGASPGQVRRSVALQAAIVAVPATMVGCVLAVPGGTLWVAAMKSHGVLPHAVQFRPQLVAVPVALGIELVTSVLGASIASIRTSRLAPALALAESSTGRRRVSPVRIALGALLVAGGVVLSAVLSRFAPEEAGDAAFFVMLAECVGVGMLAPLVLRLVARCLRPVLTSGIPRLAVDNLTTMTRSLSGALIPLVLAAAFAVVKVAIHTTTASVTGTSDPAADLWTDYSGTAVYSAFASVAALNCLITVLVGRRRDLAAMQLAGGTRRDLIRMAWCETAIVTATALVLAAAVAGATLVPILHTSLDRWLPYIPIPIVAAGMILVGTVVATGMVAPAAVLTRRSPTEVVGTST
jgi:putative ABC transport system permease protein